MTSNIIDHPKIVSRENGLSRKVLLRCGDLTLCRRHDSET
jgi:hypothetical protein